MRAISVALLDHGEMVPMRGTTQSAAGMPAAGTRDGP